jgi:Zn-dependent protease
MSEENIQQILQTLSIALIPGILAITLHEVAHGWVAKQLGDPTAYMLGRLTLNPLKHVDPLGTVVVPIAMLVLSGGAMSFGWAKPVPVAFRNLRHPKRDMVLVAAAGPISNFLMATFWALLAAALSFSGSESTATQWLFNNCVFGMQINVILAVFNLLPIPPLDGSGVAVSLFGAPAARLYATIAPFGFLILILLLSTKILRVIFAPFQQLVLRLVFGG